MRFFFQELFGSNGQNILWKIKMFLDIFPEKSLAKKSLRKKKLEYSQPRNLLAQKIPGDNRIFWRKFLDYCTTRYIIKLKSLPSQYRIIASS